MSVHIFFHSLNKYKKRRKAILQLFVNQLVAFQGTFTQTKSRKHLSALGYIKVRVQYCSHLDLSSPPSTPSSRKKATGVQCCFPASVSRHTPDNGKRHGLCLPGMLPTGKCSNAADFEVCPRVLRLPSLCFPLGGPPPPRPLPTWREIQFSQTRRHDRRKGATLGLCRGVEEHIPVTVIDILINFFLKFISLSKSCKWERMVRVLTRYGSWSGTYV